MSIVFTQSPSFISGSSITAQDHCTLADAFNSRLRSGIADGTKRIHLYNFYNFRQVRNPVNVIDDIWNYPSMMEFPAFYQMYDYDLAGGGTWPEAGRGEAEGSNLANPAMQFVFGIVNGDGTPVQDGEGDTFSKFFPFFLSRDAGGNDPIYAYWNLAKYQRGGIDHISGSMYSPMFECAQSHSMITFPNWSKHGKSPGGYLPQPQVLGLCTNPLYDIAFPNQQIFFTRLSDHYVVTYSGTCGPDFGGSITDVAYIYNGPYSYYVYQFNGTVTVYPKTLWIQGPYTGGGNISRVAGNQIERLMIAPFISEFKGTDFQRTGSNCLDLSQVAFSNEEFFNSQYQLAPAYATLSGNTIVATYPDWTFNANVTGSILSGSIGTPISITTGFRHGGTFISASRLTSPCNIAIISDGNISKIVTIPTSGSYIYTHDAGATGSINFKFANNSTYINSGGSVFIEVSILADYKPQLIDAYALIRASTATSVSDTEMDQRGYGYGQSKQIYDNYKAYGAFVQTSGTGEIWQSTTAVNTNPVYDASRRFVNNITRTINGHDMQLTSRKLVSAYETSQSLSYNLTLHTTTSIDHSVLYIKRYHSGLGLTTNNIDMFAGIINGDGTNAIASSAPTGSNTNEWLMYMCSKPFRSDENSNWKPSNYTDYFGYVNRCHIRPDYYGVLHNHTLAAYLQEVPPDIDGNTVSNMSALFRGEIVAPDAVSAYNYASSDESSTWNIMPDNSDADMSQSMYFYKSCPIYQPDYEIESARVVQMNGEDTVRLAFKTRFQHMDFGHSTGSVNIDSSTWTRGDIWNEEYRTDENAIREFLLLDIDAFQPLLKQGDTTLLSPLRTETDVPNGACYPTFFFTKLIPKPYVPTGSTCPCTNYQAPMINSDRYQQAELYLAAMCEGYIDGYTSQNSCTTDFNTAYDYTYENLVYDATGGSYTSIPLCSIIKRPDAPRGFGPLPNQAIDASTLDIIGKCINKLTQARLILPWKLQTKIDSYTGTANKAADWGSADGCNRSTPNKAIFFGYTGPAAGAYISTTGWSDSTFDNSIISSIGTGWSTDGCNGQCSDALYTFVTGRQLTYYRFALVDPLSVYALNSDLYSLITTQGSAGFYGTYLNITDTYTAQLYTPSPIGNWDASSICGYDASSCAVTWNVDATSGYRWILNHTVSTGCAFYTNGTLDVGSTAPAGDCGAALSLCHGPSPSCPNVFCNYGGQKSYEVNVKNTRDLILNVPTI